MVAIVLVIAVIILLVAVGLGQTAAPQRQPRVSPEPLEPLEPTATEPTPTELAIDDPVAALLRYGTPADAARLAEQGVDLAKLGYRAPRA